MIFENKYVVYYDLITFNCINSVSSQSLAKFYHAIAIIRSKMLLCLPVNHLISRRFKSLIRPEEKLKMRSIRKDFIKFQYECADSIGMNATLTISLLASYMLVIYSDSVSANYLYEQCGLMREEFSTSLGPWTALLHTDGSIFCAGTLITDGIHYMEHTIFNIYVNNNAFVFSFHTDCSELYSTKRRVSYLI